MTDLEALAGRVEQATGPDRELDVEIAQAIGFSVNGVTVDKLLSYSPHNTIAQIAVWASGDPTPFFVMRYTASIDAAMSLVPEECLAMVRHLWDGQKRCGYAFVSQYQTDAEESDGKMWVTDFTGCAETPALALTAAALRARAQAQEADRG